MVYVKRRLHMLINHVKLPNSVIGEKKTIILLIWRITLNNRLHFMMNITDFRWTATTSPGEDHVIDRRSQKASAG